MLHHWVVKLSVDLSLEAGIVRVELDATDILLKLILRVQGILVSQVSRRLVHRGIIWEQVHLVFFVAVVLYAFLVAAVCLRGAPTLVRVFIEGVTLEPSRARS